MHLKVKYCQTLREVNTFTGENESTVIVEGGQNDSKKFPCANCVNSQNRQLTDFDLYSYLPLKCSYSRTVNQFASDAV